MPLRTIWKVGGQAVLGRQFHHTTPWLTGRHGEALIEDGTGSVGLVGPPGGVPRSTTPVPSSFSGPGVVPGGPNPPVGPPAPLNSPVPPPI